MEKKIMEEKILESLLLRPGMTGKKEFLADMIHDSVLDIRDAINFDEGENIPEVCETVVKELTLMRFNREGAEGISSESHSGVSTSYLDDLPADKKRIIYRNRRLIRRRR